VRSCSFGDVATNVESDLQRKARLTKARQKAEAELGLARVSRDRHRMVVANAAYKKALADFEDEPQLGADPRS
jgi:hypothetical protein